MHVTVIYTKFSLNTKSIIRKSNATFYVAENRNAMFVKKGAQKGYIYCWKIHLLCFQIFFYYFILISNKQSEHKDERLTNCF